MSLRQQYQVLVLFVCAAIAWVGGCAGVAEPLPSLSVTPNVLSVSAKVGTSSSQAVSVTNIGTGPVSVNQAIVTGQGFSLTGLTTPMTLTPNQTQTFSVKFAAGTAGTVASTEGPAPHGRGTRRPPGRPPHQDPGPRIAVRPPRYLDQDVFLQEDCFHD